ncbi:hypothetical protein Dda_6594 [Drechslerella dactyloides]|uniref:Uncharacterized protein n=1 Tax=Drechslerella dactyloides TaxID=74499 RepID=A0AAD6NHJ7_DREDA|nr:hypothetical protein Dda_6594 [Drechslerella dactyloides]
MRLPAAVVLLLLYAAGPVVGQGVLQEVNPDVVDTTTSTPEIVSTTPITSETSTTTTPTPEPTTSTTTTSVEETSTSSSFTTSTPTSTPEISTTSTSSTTSTETTTEISTETSTTETSTETSTETPTSTSISSTETSTTETSTTETTTTETSTTETSTTETSSTTATETSTTSTSTTDSSTTFTTSTTPDIFILGISTTTTESSSTTTTESSSSTTEETSSTTTTESTTTTSTTSESSTSTDTTTSTSATESTSSTSSSSSESSTSTSTSSESSTSSTSTTTDSSTSTSTTSSSSTSSSETSSSTTSSETSSETSSTSSSTTDSSSSSTSSDTSSSSSSSTSSTSSETSSSTSSESSSSTSSSTSESSTTTSSNSTTTDTSSTSSEETSSSTSTSRARITEYVRPTARCTVAGARCNFMQMEVEPTVYIVTTLTVDPSATTAKPAGPNDTPATPLAGNTDVTTISPGDPILRETDNIVPSSFLTQSESSYEDYATTIQFVFNYNLPFDPSDPEPTGDDVITSSASAPCPDDTVLVTIPAGARYTLSAPKYCVEYQFFANFTRTQAITTKTAVVIETKGQAQTDNAGFGANSMPKGQDMTETIPPNQKTQNQPVETGVPFFGGGVGRSSGNPNEQNQNPTPDPRPANGPFQPATGDQNRQQTQDPGPQGPGQKSQDPNQPPEQGPVQRPTGGGGGQPPSQGPNVPASNPAVNPASNPAVNPAVNPGSNPSNPQPSGRPGPGSQLPNSNPAANPTDSNARPQETFNPDDFTAVMGPIYTGRPAPGQTAGPNPGPTRNSIPQPSVEAVPGVTTINGVRTTTTGYVGITMVPGRTTVRMPNGQTAIMTVLTESRIPLTSFTPTISAGPVVTTINGRRTTLLNVQQVTAVPTVIPVTTTINGRRTVISSTFYLPSTVQVPQFTPFLTTTLAPTIINGIPTFGPSIVTLAPIVRTTFLTEVEDGTTRIRETTYIVPATSTLPNPLLQTIKLTTEIGGTTTTVDFPVSLSASPTSRVITTTIDGTQRVITTTFFVPRGTPVIDLPSAILKTTTIDGRETVLSEFYSIRPVTITTSINGRKTILLVPSIVPITTPARFFSTSYVSTRIDGRPTSFAEVYFLEPTRITTVISGRTTTIDTTVPVLFNGAELPEATTTAGVIGNFGNSTTNSTSNVTRPSVPKSEETPTGTVSLIRPTQDRGAATSLGLSSILVYIGAVFSSLLLVLV